MTNPKEILIPAVRIIGPKPPVDSNLAEILQTNTANVLAQAGRVAKKFDKISQISYNGRFEVTEEDTDVILGFRVGDNPQDVHELKYTYADPKNPDFNRNYALVERSGVMQLVQDYERRFERVLATETEDGFQFEKGVGSKRQIRAIGVVGIFKARLDAIEQDISD